MPVRSHRTRIYIGIDRVLSHGRWGCRCIHTNMGVGGGWRGSDLGWLAHILYCPFRVLLEFFERSSTDDFAAVRERDAADLAAALAVTRLRPIDLHREHSVCLHTRYNILSLILDRPMPPSSDVTPSAMRIQVHRLWGKGSVRSLSACPFLPLRARTWHFSL